MTELKAIILEHAKKMRMTFSRIIPDLKLKGGVAAFFNPTAPELLIYSITDGNLVFDKIQAKNIVETLFKLEVAGYQWNTVDDAKMRLVKTTFSHIRESEKDWGQTEREDSSQELNDLKRELQELFVDRYLR